MEVSRARRLTLDVAIPFLDTTRFHGSLSGHGSSVDIGSLVMIDCLSICHDADLMLPPDEPRGPAREARVWSVRQCRRFRRIVCETPSGRVTIGGPQQGLDAQEPSGFLAIHRPEGNTDPD